MYNITNIFRKICISALDFDSYYMTMAGERPHIIVLLWSPYDDPKKD